MMLALTGIAIAAPVVPITSAAWVQANFADGKQVGPWMTDLGTFESDVPAQIVDGRVLVPFRFAIEPFGGTATWGSNKDGTTSWVAFYAPPTRTVTVVETVTNTVVVTNTVTATVYVQTPQNVLRTKDDMPDAFYPPYFLRWHGTAPIPSTLTTFSNVTVYIQAPNATIFTAQFLADKWGFFEGSYMLTDGIEPGNWRLVAMQGNWSSEVGFTVLGPPAVP
jgi:hypothetical protein